MKDKTFKKFIPLFLILIFILSTLPDQVFAIDLPDPSREFFYYDQMGVLKETSKEEIMKTNIELQGKTKAQVVLATINDLEGYPVEDYALELFRKWKIGDGELNNGALILLAKEPSTDRYSIYITTGYGLEGILNDGKVGRIIDEYFLPLVDRNDLGTFDEALMETFRAVISQVAIEYGIELEGNYQDYINTLNNQGDGIDLFTILILIILIAFYLNFWRGPRGPRGRRRRYRGGYYGGYSSPGSFGGGFSGGGSSSGGFGGGFSGGGGSSGGGGAGRSF